MIYVMNLGLAVCTSERIAPHNSLILTGALGQALPDGIDLKTITLKMWRILLEQ
jgi:hypothetical protein